MPSDFNLGTNCVFNTSNPNITASNYSYTLNTTVLTLNSISVTESIMPTLTSVEVDTFVVYMSQAPNINGNTNGNREGNNNIDQLNNRTNR